MAPIAKGKKTPVAKATSATKAAPSAEKIIGYCVKCKEKQTIVDPKEVKLKNGRVMMKGKCEKCGTVVCRFMPVA